MHSVKELIALAKEKPGQLQYASAGVGSFQHLGGELFKSWPSVNMLHVPFKGGGPAMIDVVGGHTKVMFSSLVQTTPQIKAGKLRALGTGGSKRSPVLPDVPTVAEAGVPGLRGGQLVGHRRARRHARADRRRVCTKRSPRCRIRPRFRSSSRPKAPKSSRRAPTSSAHFMVSEMNKWEHVVKEGGIKAE